MEHIVGDEGTLKGTLIKEWFEEQINEIFENKFSAVAFLKEDKIQAAALFNNYTGNNIDFHYYGPKISRGNYRVIIDYVFNVLKCNRLTTIPHRKDKSVIILPRMGFMQEAILKYYYGVDDCDDGLVYVLTKSKAMDWLKYKSK